MLISPKLKSNSLSQPYHTESVVQDASLVESLYRSPNSRMDEKLQGLNEGSTSEILCVKESYCNQREIGSGGCPERML